MRWNVPKPGREVWPNEPGSGRCGAEAKKEKVSKIEPKRARTQNGIQFIRITGIWGLLCFPS